MKKETYIIQAPSQGSMYFFPHYPIKYKWEKNKNDKRVKKLVTGRGGSFKNDRHALAAGKKYILNLKISKENLDLK